MTFEVEMKKGITVKIFLTFQGLILGQDLDAMEQLEILTKMVMMTY